MFQKDIEWILFVKNPDIHHELSSHFKNIKKPYHFSMNYFTPHLI